jgi:hypothetical protein
MSLSEDYGVNPYIFGAIYVGAIPFFLANMGWLVRRLRQGKPVTLQVLIAGSLAMSAYVYLLFAGENLPTWVYVAIAALVVYGLWSIYRKIRSQTGELDEAG